MTALPQSTRRKLSPLELAQELKNVSKACRIIGCHRISFYEIRRAFQVGGVEGLVEEKRGAMGPTTNKVLPQIEAEILQYALDRPTYAPQRIANELRLKGQQVRGAQRLAAAPARDQTQTITLTDEQVKLLERHSRDFRCRHIESSRPGELLNQDTYYWGTLKGVAKVYVQVDVFCPRAFAKAYTAKLPVTACGLLYERVLTLYEEINESTGAILTDNKREFCSREDSHLKELLLEIEETEHRTGLVRTPRTNGFVERMNRTLLDECFRIAGLTIWHIEPSELQRDLDWFLAFYNQDRTHQGYRLQGRTPAQAMREPLDLPGPPPMITSDVSKFGAALMPLQHEEQDATDPAA